MLTCVPFGLHTEGSPSSTTPAVGGNTRPTTLEADLASDWTLTLAAPWGSGLSFVKGTVHPHLRGLGEWWVGGRGAVGSVGHDTPPCL